MMFKLESKESRLNRLESFHRHFAWFPVPIGNGQYAWLETVLRRAVVIPTKKEVEYFTYRRIKGAEEPEVKTGASKVQ